MSEHLVRVCLRCGAEVSDTTEKIADEVSFGGGPMVVISVLVTNLPCGCERFMDPDIRVATTRAADA